MKTSQMVDLLGQLRAQLADLEKKEADLCMKLKRFGPGRRDGKLFSALISLELRPHTDWAQLCKDLKITKGVREKYTKRKEIKVLRVTARQPGASTHEMRNGQLHQRGN